MNKLLLLLSLVVVLGSTGCKKEKTPDDEFQTIALNSTATESRLISAMLGTHANIRITGSMNQNDFKVLHENTTIKRLDLSKATIVGDVCVGYDEEGAPLIQNGNALPYGAFGKYDVITPDGTDVFPANETIQEIKLPETLTTIGRNSFMDCIGLSRPLVFPAGLTRIMNGAFSGCRNIPGELRFPADIETIGELAFRACSSLTGTLTIPKDLAEVANSAFTRCSGFTKLILHDDIETIHPTAFSGMKGLTTLTLPKNLIRIGYSAFQGCTGLRGDLTLPEDLILIQDRVFVNCGFDGTLTLNKNLNEIQMFAFDATNFKTIICPWPAEEGFLPKKWTQSEQWFPSNFEAKNGKREYIIYIPTGSMDFYVTNFSDDEGNAFFNFKEGKPL